MKFQVLTRRINAPDYPDAWAFWIFRDDESTACHFDSDYPTRAAAREAARQWIDDREAGFR